MTKKIFLLVFAFGIIAKSFAIGNPGKYRYTVDLTQIKDDKLFVELAVPKIKESEIIYYMPKIIPGTYSIADYGRYVSDLKAFDKKGRALTVTRLDDNSWKITNANKLAKLSYWIEDSYDSELAGPGIFQPAGTNFEEGKNFVINTPGFFGYFEGMKQIDFEFDIIRPENFYGGTGLVATNKINDLSTSLGKENKQKDNLGKVVDSYSVESYDRLVDSPLMYAEADTALISVGNTEVLISSYSPNKVVSAKEISETLREILSAQYKYLGGKLPVDKYAFVFYFTDQPVTSYGALEHSYSSLYYMPENTIDAMRQQLRDFAAHEFFHIVTPLNIHSQEIHEFNFNDPKMSRHLWMYEGMTEYFAGNMQVKYDIISDQQYLQILRQKMIAASNFIDSVAFTDISKFTLEKYSSQYGNVYQKGALIGMCLDIQLRDLSNGQYGVQNMMADLAKKYGKDQAFSDELLFDEITKMTYPEVGAFLEKYVGGSASLPYQEVFKKVGINYLANEQYMDVDLGITQAVLGIDPEAGSIFISNEAGLNEFGKLLGFKTGDIIRKINGIELPPLGPETGPFIGARRAELIVGDNFSYTVSRGEEEVKLEAAVIKIEKSNVHQVSFDESATEAQLSLRDSWLSPIE
jgi:predicted metalloprotease with PDZ domain